MSSNLSNFYFRHIPKNGFHNSTVGFGFLHLFMTYLGNVKTRFIKNLDKLNSIGLQSDVQCDVPNSTTINVSILR